jgi:RimJ/RimL family protein N-acetyltransferase
MSISPYRTERLTLVPSDPSLASSEGSNRPAFFRALGVLPSPVWPPELQDENTIAYNQQQLARGDSQSGWWCWYFILETEDGARLIGSGGFFGPPDPDGSVEIGYSILNEFRRQGFAAEALGGLCDVAQRRGAKLAVVKTLETLLASVRSAQAAGFIGPERTAEAGVVQLKRTLQEPASGAPADQQRA